MRFDDLLGIGVVHWWRREVLKFRPQRRLLAEAMAEVREFDGTWAGLQGLLDSGDVIEAVEAYGGVDERIGWDTYIVTATHPSWPNPGPYVVGFTNGPVPH